MNHLVYMLLNSAVCRRAVILEGVKDTHSQRLAGRDPVPTEGTGGNARHQPSIPEDQAFVVRGRSQASGNFGKTAAPNRSEGC